jgi:hypothetical protein
MPSTEAARWRWASSYPPPICVMGWKYETGSTLWTRSPCPAHTEVYPTSLREILAEVRCASWLPLPRAGGWASDAMTGGAGEHLSTAHRASFSAEAAFPR